MKIECFNPATDKKGQSTTKIHHYTSPEGLKGILGNSTLRFSDCQFLNDKSEFIHIQKPLYKALDMVSNKINPTFYEVVKDLFDDNYETEMMVISERDDFSKKWSFITRKIRRYVFCASNDGDALNMWNYYVKNGKYEGYSICFTVNRILESFQKYLSEDRYKDISIYHGKVIYKENDQVSFLKGLLLSKNSSLIEKGVELSISNFPTLRDEIAGELLLQLQNYRLFFKNEAFAQENEYRFVISIPVDIKMGNSSIDLMVDESKFIKKDYRINNGVVMPFYNVPFDKEKSLNSITISPIIENELAIQGLGDFLVHNGYKIGREKINQSKIPIRY